MTDGPSSCITLSRTGIGGGGRYPLPSRYVLARYDLSFDEGFAGGAIPATWSNINPANQAPDQPIDRPTVMSLEYCSTCTRQARWACCDKAKNSQDQLDANARRALLLTVQP